MAGWLQRNEALTRAGKRERVRAQGRVVVDLLLRARSSSSPTQTDNFIFPSILVCYLSPVNELPLWLDGRT